MHSGRKSRYQLLTLKPKKRHPIKQKIGKINTGDKIKVVKKTDIYKVSGGIYDCFYEVESDVGKGYVFGAYISDNTETLVFEGNKQVYFDKLHNYTIKIPTKIDAVDFFILGHSKQEFLFKFYYFSEKEKYDLAKQIVCAVLNNDTFGIINCCSGKPVAMKDQVLKFITPMVKIIKPDIWPNSFGYL